MKEWLAAWWRQIIGPPASDPWHDDPRIRAERHGQHQRIDKVTGWVVRDEWNRRLRDSWRPHNGGQ